jgi:PIN domain nuclease of toxin-antitoxin system
MILLDTNALIWLHHNHARAAALAKLGRRLYASPASLLELEILFEAGRVELRGTSSVSQMIRDDRWVIDDPPSVLWFEEAMTIGWTRDTFDRLLVAHARLRKWTLATSDQRVITQLRPNEYLEL